jgi:hypothetical protein
LNHNFESWNGHGFEPVNGMEPIMRLN